MNKWNTAGSETGTNTSETKYSNKQRNKPMGKIRSDLSSVCDLGHAHLVYSPIINP